MNKTETQVAERAGGTKGGDVAETEASGTAGRRGTSLEGRLDGESARLGLRRLTRAARPVDTRLRCEAMKRSPQDLDAKVRSDEKKAARVDDERALLTGRKSADDLRRENEAIAQLAQFARVNLRASWSLG